MSKERSVEPVALTGEQIHALADRMLVQAYLVRAKSRGRMHLTRPSGRYAGTIKGFRALTGRSVTTWPAVERACIEILEGMK